jgi:predicted 2-oxoglutarate/Fe(II)-dependent dioxygenase YbiX
MPAYVEEIRGVLTIQLYDAASCDRITKYAERANDWAAASVGEASEGRYASAVRPEYRVASTFSPSPESAVIRGLRAKVNDVLEPLLKRVWRTDLNQLTDTHIVRYTPGGFYVAHADGGLDLSNRYFTVLCYLNDDFQGGRTSFPLFSYSVTPQKGKTILFPSTYIHRAEPVVAGTKYVLVSWLRGPDPLQWI